MWIGGAFARLSPACGGVEVQPRIVGAELCVGPKGGVKEQLLPDFTRAARLEVSIQQELCRVADAFGVMSVSPNPKYFKEKLEKDESLRG